MVGALLKLGGVEDEAERDGEENVREREGEGVRKKGVKERKRE